MNGSPLCLVTGATGYIGGRLVPLLLERGYRVRVLARHPERLRQRDWYDRVDVVAGDATDPEAVDRAMGGVDVAYFLLHSLTTGKELEERERRLATTFSDAAHANGVRRIVYLGGMIPKNREGLSRHLRSRETVGRVLRDSGVPTIELRAAVIIGSGSASFEMLRYLTERLPVMVAPTWVRTRTQPIAVRDVLHYLVGAVAVPGDVNDAFDIGGPDVMTYESMMSVFAEVAGLRRRVIMPVRVLSPSLSSHWVGLVTPVPRGIARPLVDSLRSEVVCADHRIAEIIPDPPNGLVPYRRAVELALQRIREANVVTRWSSASVKGAPAEPLPGDPDWAGGTLYSDVRELEVPAMPEAVWQVVEGIGGERGYLTGTWMWEVRGLLDRAMGGVGVRRGRRDPDRLAVGDALDFWRVEERVKPELLRLRAEMRLPGRAWLEWRITPTDTGSVLRQRAVFYPRGLAGHAYWASMVPFHAFVFRPMAKHIGSAAQEAAPLGEAAEPSPPSSTAAPPAAR